MSGWSAAATSQPSRSLSSWQDQTTTQTRRPRRRWPSSKRPEPPTSSPTSEAPRSYTTSRDLTSPWGFAYRPSRPERQLGHGASGDSRPWEWCPLRLARHRSLRGRRYRLHAEAAGRNSARLPLAITRNTTAQASSFDRNADDYDGLLTASMFRPSPVGLGRRGLET